MENASKFTENPFASGRIQTGFTGLVKTALLAAIVVAFLYLILFINWSAWTLDFRIWTLAVKVFDVGVMLPTMLRYALFFGIFFSISALFNENYRAKSAGMGFHPYKRFLQHFRSAARDCDPVRNLYDHGRYVAERYGARIHRSDPDGAYPCDRHGNFQTHDGKNGQYLARRVYKHAAVYDHYLREYRILLRLRNGLIVYRSRSKIERDARQ